MQKSPRIFKFTRKITIIQNSTEIKSCNTSFRLLLLSAWPEALVPCADRIFYLRSYDLTGVQRGSHPLADVMKYTYPWC